MLQPRLSDVYVIRFSGYPGRRTHRDYLTAAAIAYYYSCTFRRTAPGQRALTSRTRAGGDGDGHTRKRYRRARQPATTAEHDCRRSAPQRIHNIITVPVPPPLPPTIYRPLVPGNIA